MHTRRRVAPAPRGKHARKQLPSTNANTQEHKHAETRDRTGDLQIFGLTLSQLSYRGCNRPPGIPKPSPACGRKHASSKPNKPKQDHPKRRASTRSTCGLVAMTSAPHAEGRQFDPGQVYFVATTMRCAARPGRCGDRRGNSENMSRHAARTPHGSPNKPPRPATQPREWHRRRKTKRKQPCGARRGSTGNKKGASGKADCGARACARIPVMEPESTPTVHSGKLAAVQPRTLADKLRNWQAASCATATDTEKGLRDRNSPTCTSS